MPKFVLEKINEIIGPIAIFKLEIDGKCPINDFWKETSRDGNLKRQLYKVQSIMEDMAKSFNIPPQKLRSIGNVGTLKGYEIKTHDLRVYLFHEDKTGKIIVLGGKKGNQDRELNRFKNIAKEYYQTLNK